jgi:hypothetical protein
MDQPNMNAMAKVEILLGSPESISNRLRSRSRLSEDPTFFHPSLNLRLHLTFSALADFFSILQNAKWGCGDRPPHPHFQIF